MCNLYVQKFGIPSNVAFNNVNEKLLIIKNSGGKKIKKSFVGAINLERPYILQEQIKRLFDLLEKIKVNTFTNPSDTRFSILDIKN